MALPPRHPSRSDRSMAAAAFAAAAVVLLLLIVARDDRPPRASSRSRNLAGGGGGFGRLVDPKTVESKTPPPPPPPSSPSPPGGLRLLLVGDSSMHGQYLSLTRYLRYNEWSDSPALDSGEAGATWEEFYGRTTSALRPDEACDCAGNPEGEGRAFRVFRDPVRDNAVVYLPSPPAAVGSDPPSFRAHLWPCLSLKAIEGGYGLGTLEEYLTNEAADPRRQRSFLEGKDWSEAVKFVSDHMFLTPDRRLRPTHALIGPGVTGGGLCGDARRDERIRLIEALRRTGTLPVWRTSLLEGDEGGGGGCGAAVDVEMCGSDEVLCLDAKEFASGGGDDAQMPSSFERPLYRALNERLLDLMERTLPEVGPSRI